MSHLARNDNLGTDNRHRKRLAHMNLSRNELSEVSNLHHLTSLEACDMSKSPNAAFIVHNFVDRLRQ